ncbi:MAG: HD-GYP domain-containing protein [Armatimonadota bacterium]|nr:HD-GYP domain-containing protein [Armatimonadota bacterium]
MASTALATETLLSPYLVRGDFTDALWPARRADIHRYVRVHLRDEGLVAVTLWNRRGVAIYSTDRSLAGRRVLLPAPAQTALAGGVAAELRYRRAPSPDARGGRPFLHVYVPVRMPGSARPEGVYEVVRDARGLVEHLNATRQRVWLIVLSGVAVLYACLFGLVRGASAELVRQQRVLKDAFEGTIRSLATAVDAKDAATGGHSARVARYAEAIAGALALPEDDREVVRLAGFLHDLGKVGMPDRLLRAARPLAADDWRVIRQHVVVGHQILAPVPIDGRVKLAVRHSHERWDGTGYPDGLAGEAIPLHARILAVADAFEAMTSDRPYRKAWPVEHALAEIVRHAGTQFDPAVVQAFTRWAATEESLRALRGEPMPAL